MIARMAGNIASGVCADPHASTELNKAGTRQLDPAAVATLAVDIACNIVEQVDCIAWTED